jgi:hypothetical protein
MAVVWFFFGQTVGHPALLIANLLGRDMANLDDLAGSNKEALVRLGGAIGLLADLSGAFSTITGIISFLENLTGGGPDPTQQALQEIQNMLSVVLVDQKGEDLLARWRDLDQYLIPAEAVFRNLLSDINANPPLSSGEKSNRILTCLNAVLAFEIGEGDDKWKAVRGEQTDYFVLPLPSNPFMIYEGQGLNGYAGLLSYDDTTFTKTFIPDADASGLVFNYTYVLPAYMRSLMIFLAVGAGLDDHFLENQRGQLRASAAVLQGRHDFIKAGIVNIAAPTLSDLQTVPGSRPPMSRWHAAGLPVLTSLQSPFPFGEPFGAVNIYSGASSVDSYAQGRGTTDDKALTRFYGKYLLRAVNRSKEVYRNIGLVPVLDVTNLLRRLSGDAPLSGPSFGDWSLRSAFGMLGGRSNPDFANVTYPLSARLLESWLASAPPLDSSPLSTLRHRISGQT